MRRVVLTVVLSLFAGLLLGGCTPHRYDGKRAPDPSKAILAGAVVEGYLTQPHGLVVHIQRTEEPMASVRLETLNGSRDDLPNNNLRGNYFMYEVPPGTYEVVGWNYQYYAGKSLARKEPVRIQVRAGEVAYIGDFYANAILFCLSNVDRYEQTLARLKEKYPLLKDQEILNLAKESAFQNWPSSDAEDSGKGFCKI